jgi:adenine-specific DNA glycosylase
MLPVKIKPQKSMQEERTLLLVEENGKILLWQRPPHSRLMPGFWELPEPAQLPEAVPGERMKTFRHGITFHDYGFELRATAVPKDIGGCRWVAITELSTLPLSTIAKKALRGCANGVAKAASHG